MEDTNKQKNTLNSVQANEQIEKAYQEFLMKIAEAKKRFNAKIDKILSDIDKRRIEKIKREIGE